MSSRSYAPIVTAALAAIVVAALGSTMTDLGPWYQGLRKPSWQPPDWLFGPAWTIIFACTAVSAATAWRDAPGNESREWVAGLFALNGCLNVLWSFLFFRAQRPDWALIEVAALGLSILVLIVFTARFSRAASLLLVPYIAWVTFAAILNWAVLRLNPIG